LFSTVIFVALLAVALAVLLGRRASGNSQPGSPEGGMLAVGSSPGASSVPVEAVPAPPPSAEVAISFSLPDRIPDLGRPIPRRGANSWIINPNGSFSITLYSTTENVVYEIKRLLDQRFTRQGDQGSYKSIQPFFLSGDVRCKEIDDYVANFRPIYLQKIDELKIASSEWSASSERDREDLLKGFCDAAISALDVRPAFVDLKVLLDGTPDLVGTGELVKRLGLDAVDMYAAFAVGKRKVLAAPVGHRSRPKLERLVEAGLARRGAQIPVHDILATLSVKELRELAADSNQAPALVRKNQAVDYAASLNDISQRLAAKVALREFFELLALPAEFSKLSLPLVLAALSYTRQLAVLVSETYVRVGYESLDCRAWDRVGEVANWEFAAQDRACPMCRRAATATTTAKGPRPNVPLHIGCACRVWPR